MYIFCVIEIAYSLGKLSDLVAICPYERMDLEYQHREFKNDDENCTPV